MDSPPNRRSPGGETNSSSESLHMGHANSWLLSIIMNLCYNISNFFTPFVIIACIAITSCAIFFFWFHYTPVIAAPISSHMVGSSIDSKISIKKNERLIEERLLVNMKIQKIDDVEVIRSLMEIIVKAQKTLWWMKKFLGLRDEFWFGRYFWWREGRD